MDPADAATPSESGITTRYPQFFSRFGKGGGKREATGKRQQMKRQNVKTSKSQDRGQQMKRQNVKTSKSQDRGQQAARKAEGERREAGGDCGLGIAEEK